MLGKSNLMTFAKALDSATADYDRSVQVFFDMLDSCNPSHIEEAKSQTKEAHDYMLKVKYLTEKRKNRNVRQKKKTT